MGLFISALTSFTSVSVIVTDPLTAWLCNSSLGWRSSFYLHAAFGFLVFTLWIIFYVDDPQSHPNVSEKELAKIQKEKTQAHIERDSFVPYQKIMKNKTILVVWFNAFVELVSITMLYVYAPTYFNSALGFDVSSTGLLVSFAALSHLLVKLAGGVVSDTLAYVFLCPLENSTLFYSFATNSVPI
ncbi:MFS domain-containing protein [Trichostrongylus colubriformis]|uniref:MFS domain-containing protein n=1 Tax=Trichostrongylus colubriformis TaxID=6319 RepID=A0AAN8FYN7_TRICO